MECAVCEEGEQEFATLKTIQFGHDVSKYKRLPDRS